MKLETITLQNFQSFGSQPTRIRFDDLTALIGANGTGKTAVLAALSRLFCTTPGYRGLRRSDFHVPPPAGNDAAPRQISLVIDIRLRFPELGAEAGQTGGDAVPQCFRHMAVDEANAPPFCRIRLEATWTATNLAEGEIEERMFWVRSSDDVPLDEHKVPFRASERGMIHVIYVPAARDPTREIRAASVALLGRLLNVIQWPTDTRQRLAEGSQHLDQLITASDAIGTIQDRLLRRWGVLHDDPVFATPTLRFTVGELEDFLRGVEVRFSPAHGGSHNSIDRLSDGMKSLFYFALVAAVFDVEQQAAGAASFDHDRLAPPSLTILAVEEPENHVAPHLLGRIMELLDTIASAPAGQVVLTSHSAGILGRVEPGRVRYLRLLQESRTTQVKELVLPDPVDEAYKYIKEAVRSYPELYFARFVVLGEGDTEELLLPRIMRTAGMGLDARLISVVPLGGRHVRHLWRLLSDLCIPYVTLLDLDQERYGGGWGRIITTCRELLGINVPRADLLTQDGRTLTDEELDRLDGTPAELQMWMTRLEGFGVFFSAPLDLDLLMLEAYTTTYQSLGGRGPRVPVQNPARAQRLDAALRAVLGEEGGDGASYTQAQRELFVWYSYLFLGRGKPATHVLALSRLNDEELEGTLPAILGRLREHVRRVTVA